MNTGAIRLSIDDRRAALRGIRVSRVRPTSGRVRCAICQRPKQAKAGYQRCGECDARYRELAAGDRQAA